MQVDEIACELRAGNSVKFNQRSLHPDLEEGLVWGVDEYGCDALLTKSRGSQDDHFRRAAEWMLAERSDPHPAEFSW